VSRGRGAWLLPSLMTAAAASCSSVYASTLEPDTTTPGIVLLNDDQRVNATSYATMTPLMVPGAGELFVSLTDKDFPAPFAALGFGLSEPGVTLDPFGTSGLMTLNLTQPQTVYADIFATTQSGVNAGLYNLTATFEPTAAVPLPPGAASLAGGLIVLFLGMSNLALSARKVGEQATVITPVA